MGTGKCVWPTSDNNERAELDIDVSQGNRSPLNAQPEQATAKQEQQTNAGTYAD